jgi:two-component system cell cycle response regulator CtrA
MRILLIEDDTASAKAIELTLKAQGYVCDGAGEGDGGIELGKLFSYDLILLDIMLPDMDGFDVLRALRAAKIPTPILMLSGLSDPDHKIMGLYYGADDYLTKPFDNNELIARIQALVRRSNGHSESVILTGDIAVYLDKRTVLVKGQPLHLTGKEFDVLEQLSLRKGTPVSKESLFNHVYGEKTESNPNHIDSLIFKLRKKLSSATGGDAYIETIWKRGYMLNAPSTADSSHQEHSGRAAA